MIKAGDLGTFLLTKRKSALYHCGGALSCETSCNRFHLLQEIVLVVNMAKEKQTDPEKAVRKAEKRAKKEAKRADTNGVHKSKQEKKSKEVKSTAIEDGEDDMETTAKLLTAIEKKEPISVKSQDEDEQLQVKEEVLVKENIVALVGALVPFADPLVKDKSNKKVLKGIKKGECISSPQLLAWSFGRAALKRKSTDKTLSSQQTRCSQARSERSCQSCPEKSHTTADIYRPSIIDLHPGRRHLAHGRDKSYTGALRGSQHTLCFCHIEGRSWRSIEYQKTN